MILSFSFLWEFLVDSVGAPLYLHSLHYYTMNLQLSNDRYEKGWIWAGEPTHLSSHIPPHPRTIEKLHLLTYGIPNLSTNEPPNLSANEPPNLSQIYWLMSPQISLLLSHQITLLKSHQISLLMSQQISLLISHQISLLTSHQISLLIRHQISLLKTTKSLC